MPIAHFTSAPSPIYTLLQALLQQQQEFLPTTFYLVGEPHKTSTPQKHPTHKIHHSLFFLSFDGNNNVVNAFQTNTTYPIHFFLFLLEILFWQLLTLSKRLLIKRSQIQRRDTAIPNAYKFVFFSLFNEWEHRMDTMCPFLGLHP